MSFKDKIIHKNYIILITDGFNQPGKLTTQQLMSKMFHFKINLISICYTHNKQNLEFLNGLSTSTDEGVLIDLNSLNNIDLVLESMNEKMQGNS
jgi:hypothetical protein